MTKPSRGNEAPLFTGAFCLLFTVNLFLSLTLYMANPLMSQHLSRVGIAAAAAGAVIGSMSIASMLLRPVSGWICDRFSRKALLLLFTALTAASLAGYAFARSAALFLILRVAHGISFGVTTTVTMAYVSEFLPAGRAGEGMGYFALGQSVATAIGPSLGLWLQNAAGSEAAFLTAAAIAAAGALLVLALPESAPRTRADGRLRLRPGDFIAREALPFALLTIALSAANGVETSYVAGYAQTLGLSNAGWYFTLSAAVLFLARLFLGRLGDRKSFSAVFYPAAALICAAFVLLAFLRAEFAVPMLAAASVLKAAGVGMLQPAIQAGCVSSVPPERRGAASSTYYIGADLGQGGGTAAAGGVLSAGGYSSMFLWTAVPLAFSAAAYFLYCHRIQKRKEEPVYESQIAQKH